MPQEVTSAKQWWWKGMVSRTAAPQSRPTTRLPRTPAAPAKVPAMSFGTSLKGQGLHVPCGPQAWEVLPSSQGGECPKLWAQHPLPGSAEAERGGRRARLGGGSCGREAPLPPALWLVPSTFALSNFVVGKYLLKIRHFVTFFFDKKLSF